MTDVPNAVPAFNVVTLAPNLPGPIAAKRFAHLGAHVTKVEGPGPAADPMKAQAPAYYKHLTAGQKVVELNLKDPHGIQGLHELLADAHLLLTSSRPASLARLGLGWGELHERYPHLVQVAIVGHGGEHADQAGHDLTYEAHAGTLPLGPDNTPVMPPVPLADLAGAERAVSEGLAGLWTATSTGVGSYHEVGLADMAEEFSDVARWGLSGPGTFLGGALPQYNLYQAKDGQWVAVAALEPHFLAACAEVMDFGDAQPSMDAGPTFGLQHRHYQHAIAQRTAAEWDAVASEKNIPIAAVRHHTQPTK
ncbi:CoA transferase [Corynebacterium sp. zg254]|uniref:CoA transferase n=1 Tax=Corynebacterium zhongnanshanii TaxID=2768834 RepID=A0ABQ6VEL5_9CORY|nr:MULTISPECIES: CoA transferase [Corynebacterium]KAB3522654.1 CoA transferase [Corynebacterium zhongnanshanii]MCR5914298.1 CoA transferase [Corynebacterium sp. zg254]